MKIEKQEKFTPISIILETEEELKVFRSLSGYAGTIGSALKGTSANSTYEEISRVLNSMDFRLV